MSNPIRTITSTVAVTLLLIVSAAAQTPKPTPITPKPTPVASTTTSPSDRDQDGLLGPVRKIKTEVAKLSSKTGKPTEGPRVTLESAAYDVKGTKIDTQYFPLAGGTLTGRETYKYDDQGNISEMTLFNADGSLLAKEVYRYDYDFVGNWTTMTTSVAVIEGGKITYDPTEVTHRTISYYLDEKLTKMMEAGSKPPVPATTQNVATNQPNPGTVTPGTNVPKPTNTSGNTPDNSGSANVAANHVVETKSPEIKPVDPPVTTPAAGQGNPVTSSTTKPVDTSSGTASNPSGTATPPNPEPEPVRVAPKPITKPISGGVLNGSAISLPPPTYPEVARRSRAAGIVVVEVVIDESGKVIAAKAISGPIMLYTPAMEAAKKARFSPTKLSGQPVKVTGIINYNFSLGN